jgi:CubicO group peptidase (beta-lactamase class C family)
MKLFRLWALALAALALVPRSIGALMFPSEFDLPAIDRAVQNWITEKQVVGLALAIAKDGQIIHVRGFGRTALSKDGHAVTPDTRFAIGSVTKQFACACILLLAEDGNLSVQDNVAKYYPTLTKADSITLLDLMNHTSGYPDYYPLDYVDRRMQKTIAPDELLRQYAGSKLDFEPGSNFSYSNTGYILLGRVVEKVSGRSFASFLQERLLRPLGLTNTLFEPAAGTPGLAQGYTSFALSPPEPIAPEGGGWIGAAGGIYSTPTDLARWNLALIDGKVLKPESFALMTRPRPLATGKVSDYGCGLSVRFQNQRLVLSHNGAVAGFNAWNAIVPSTRSSLVMLCNTDGGLGALPGQIFSLLLKESSTVPKVNASPAAETSRRLFLALQRGQFPRAEFSEDFNDYMTQERIAGAAKRLRSYGKPTSAEVVNAHERGGMEVTTTRLVCKRQVLRTLMYRRPDGVIEQFFIYKE